MYLEVKYKCEDLHREGYNGLPFKYRAERMGNKSRRLIENCRRNAVIDSESNSKSTFAGQEVCVIKVSVSNLVQTTPINIRTRKRKAEQSSNT